MKRMLFAILSIFWLHASAQITVTAATFPAIGDTFRYAIDLAPTGDKFITPPGGPQLWDFSDLQFEQTFETIFTSPDSGMQKASFPGANLMQRTFGESYFKVSNDKFELLGYAGGDPAGFGINVVTRFAPPIVERYSPSKFFDIHQQTTDLTLPFSTDALPDSLLANIPGANLVDSIRIRINFQRLGVVDGYGELKIPGMTMPTQVLREKRTEYTTTNLDVYIPILGWTNVPTGGTGGGLLDFLGTDTTITYRFYDNLSKDDLALLTLNNEENAVEQARFKNIDMLSDAPTINAPGTASVQAFPNPAIEWVRFDCKNLPGDDYTLKIFNIVGKVVWKETYYIAGSRSITVDLEDFKKGTYLYSLVDPEGNIIGTKRLVVVKP